jgi:hypothetical protein
MSELIFNYSVFLHFMLYQYVHAVDMMSETYKLKVVYRISVARYFPPADTLKQIYPATK